LSDAHPGDVFEIEKQGDGRYLLVRMEKPRPHERMTREACLEAIEHSPLSFSMTWEALRKTTREL